ncbi:hypothetical protein C9422_11330 [Pseudomonas sp. B1(2018)]|nr:hypothetical protein C9422_11330 [Pseudomonas sp. B1(2018)]
MDNFMVQPTYRMNRGAILTQGWRRLVRWLQRDDLPGVFAHFLSKNTRQATTPARKGEPGSPFRGQAMSSAGASRPIALRRE